MRVSVVINTCNRATYLGDTLEGLKQQTYKNFEVVLVNGPSEDNTEEVAKRYNVRYYTAPFNISVSRNVGIKNASGDILAFIDDDAVPEPNWLNDIVAAYSDEKVGAAGGLVYNGDGNGFQSCYSAISYWGYIKHSYTNAYDYNDSKGFYYNTNIGTNASFRRTALIEAGAFDEEIEYYHDESDVCVRLIKKGYKVVQLDNAFVHHKMAPSFRRDNKKQFTNWDATVKNTIYFGLKNSEGLAPLHKRLTVFLPIELKKFGGMFTMLRHGQYTLKEYLIRNGSLARSFYRGYKRGLLEDRKLIKDYKYEPEKFKKYIEGPDDFQPMNIVLVTQGFPPNSTDGISRYNHTLASKLADQGHRVFVVTKNNRDCNNIEYRNKYWIYSHYPGVYSSDVTGYGRVDSILAMSKSVYNTVSGINEKLKIDTIVAPLWDVEGLALLRKKIAPTVLTLMSPLKKVVETQWYYLKDPSLDIVYALEKYCIENADAIMPISNAIKETIGGLYDVDFSKLRSKNHIKIIPLGVDDSLIVKTKIKKNTTKNINILYVGRFERRKGVDLLLEAIEKMVPLNPNLHFHLVGNSNIRDENNQLVYKNFLKRNRKKQWLKQVHKYGYVSDEELSERYTECDIFVAPSRYESFGLIFIEAMAAGKPVVGANVGGVPEIIFDGKNGLIFENENVDDLVEKLTRLVSDSALRLSMGKESKRILDSKFRSDDMAYNFLKLAKDLDIS